MFKMKQSLTFLQGRNVLKFIKLRSGLNLWRKLYQFLFPKKLRNSLQRPMYQCCESDLFFVYLCHQIHFFKMFLPKNLLWNRFLWFIAAWRISAYCALKLMVQARVSKLSYNQSQHTAFRKGFYWILSCHSNLHSLQPKLINHFHRMLFEELSFDTKHLEKIVYSVYSFNI